jgi:large subunit ribosomal protein L31e
VPNKVRVRITRSKNEDEDAKEKFFSTIQLLSVESFSGLQTENKK